MGGDRRRRSRGRAQHAAGASPVRRPRHRDDGQRAVSRPGDRRRALHAAAYALVLRHARRLPGADQPLRAPAASHRPLDAHRRSGVQGRAQGLPALLARCCACRTQSRRIRHMACRPRAGEPARAPDHRHDRAGQARAGTAQGTDAGAGPPGPGARPRRHPSARRARRRTRDGHGLSRPHLARARDAGLEVGRRRTGRASAAGRRPHA